MRKVNIFALDVIYALSNRTSLDLTVPFLSGQGGIHDPAGSSRFYDYSATGFGDIALQAEYWLSNPAKPSRIQGSASVGIKMPTGSNSRTGTYPGGSELPIDETFQLGNGGWDILLRVQGTAALVGDLFAYGSGYYGVSLTEHTEVYRYDGAGRPDALVGVPDTYSGRLGLAFLLRLPKGLVVSVGGRINGVTVRDLIGGGDLYWRRPGYEVYIEPGLSWTSGPHIASVSVPVRVYQNKLDSLLDISKNRHIGSDFAPYLVIASYAYRF
ncbi:MAG TPA: hypothetical protein VL084_07085 [Thermoanaerobaculia bacterium]|nr:hypothetical protein [Thermoanaerobaculia bacterium]